MGLIPRMRVARLPEKLKLIRQSLKLSQGEMIRLLNFEELTDRSVISAYERGEREPPLPVLLAYARHAQISVDVLIDDALDLPENFTPHG